MNVRLLYPFGHTPSRSTPRSTNGAPQVAAVGFAAIIPLMFLLPFAELTFRGTTEPAFLIDLIRSGAGVNVCAAVLLVIPVIGITEALRGPAAWRGMSATIATVALILVLVTLALLRMRTSEIASGMEHVTPGLGSYALLLGYGIIALITGMMAIRARHVDWQRRHAVTLL